MKRILLLLAGTCALGGAVLTSGCGPGLVAAGGGSLGAIFGLQGGDEKKDDKPKPQLTTNVIPAVIVNSLTREEGPATITYTLIDANDDPCDIEVQYSVNGGAFSTCLPGAGGDGLTALSANASGVSHTFEWDFVTDLGPALTQVLTIRIRADDGTTSGSWGQLANQSIGDDPPAFFNFSANGTDIVLISFLLGDQSSDLATLDVSYSIDQGSNFTPIDTDPMSANYQLLGNPPTNLLATPGGSPGQFIWLAGLSQPDFQGDVLLRVVPKDQPSGYSAFVEGAPVVTTSFTIDTSVNGPPEFELLTATDGVTYSGSVPIDFTLLDEESNAAVVIVQYRIGTGTFQPATLVNQFASGVAGPFPAGPSPTGYSLVWDALADVGSPATFTDVVLAFVPADGTAGATTLSDAFTLVGNTAPQVLDIQPLQDSGNIPLVIDLQDSESDPVEVLVEFSTDGTNYTALSQSDFVFGTLASLDSSPVGEPNVLIWDSTIAFGGQNSATMTIRVTPTDHPPSATPAADLTGAAFTSASFPVINNPNGATPVSIDVFTTDAAGTPHTPSQVTVPAGGTKYLDNVINPSSAAGFTTFWKILEQGQDYGTLLDVSGASLTFSTGQIVTAAPGGGGVQDGDTFVIDDGLNGPQVYEFDNNFAISGTTIPISIFSMTTADEVATALADAINNNSFVRIDAVFAGSGMVNLTHTIACKLGNAASGGGGGNAADMAFSGTAGTVNAQMSGGDGTQRVRYDAPAVPPSGSDYVTLFCEIDDPSFWYIVRQEYKLWWGDIPTNVNVTPNSISLLVRQDFTFSASVVPATAPQTVSWDVVGGSANGTIDPDTGFYTAPNNVPSANPIYVRATAVDGATIGGAAVTILPAPTGVLVFPPSNNPPNWVAPNLRLGATISFTAQVLPSAAPQGVNWRIIWNAQDWGSGNSTVGTISGSGTYTAPTILPSPDTVDIQAVSQADNSIFGSYTVHLEAPPPTSFDVTPPTASVFAGGAGVQFNAVNFSPANANTSVIWFINPNVGSVTQSGYYTPPGSVVTPVVVTVTARSTVASPTVEDSALVTVNPSVIVAPSSVDISPDEGLTISASQSSQPIQFTAVVNPGGASQAVTWSFVGTPFGTLSTGGLYTPAVTNVDRLVRIRATANATPSPFDEVNVLISGDGHSWDELGNVTLGRGQASAVWEDVNDRLWIIGGTSETATARHEEVPLYIDFTSTHTVGSYQPINGQSSFSKAHGVIMAVFDEDNDRLIAVICEGTNDTVELYSLDLTQVDPIQTPPEEWQKISYGGSNNAPKLGGLQKYHCWWDRNAKELQILVGNTTIYRYRTPTSGGTSNTWMTPASTQSQGSGPTDPLVTAHAFDDSINRHYFVGATNGGAINRVWEMDASDWKWEVRTSTGTQPSGAVFNPSAYYHNGDVHVFGGALSIGSGYTSDLYSVDVSTGGAVWTRVVNTFERPQPRGDACFALAGFNGTCLYGGEVSSFGTFGDIWEYNEAAGQFLPISPENIRPQGRRMATGVWTGSEGLVYGGLTDHGIDNGTWTFTYNQTTSEPTWIRHAANGTRPGPLWGAASTWVPSLGVMIMYGGDSMTTGFAGITDKYFAYDPGSQTWSQLGVNSPPGKRRESAMCYDATNNRVWLFGGVNQSASKLSDLWYLDLNAGLPGTWNNIGAIAGSPPDPRTGATMGFNARTNTLLVCGGNSSVSGPNSQLYSYTISSSFWTPVSVGNTGSEEDVDAAAAIYDDEYQRFVSTPSARKKTQAIVLATPGTTWQYMAPPPAFNNSTGALGLYDESTGRYYALFGERTILSRNIGTNNLRTFEVK